jgi:hypothetical protein
MAISDDDGVGLLDAFGTPVTKGARVVYATGRGGGLLQRGVITRVTPNICIRRWDGRVIRIGTSKRIAVLPQQEPDSKPPTMTWVDFCRRNREHWLGRWADEELRLAQERIRVRENEDLDEWWRHHEGGS